MLSLSRGLFVSLSVQAFLHNRQLDWLSLPARTLRACTAFLWARTPTDSSPNSKAEIILLLVFGLILLLAFTFATARIQRNERNKAD